MNIELERETRNANVRELNKGAVGCPAWKFFGNGCDRVSDVDA